MVNEEHVTLVTLARDLPKGGGHVFGLLARVGKDEGAVILHRIVEKFVACVKARKRLCAPCLRMVRVTLLFAQILYIKVFKAKPPFQRRPREGRRDAGAIRAARQPRAVGGNIPDRGRKTDAPHASAEQTLDACKLTDHLVSSVTADQAVHLVQHHEGKRTKQARYIVLPPHQQAFK